MIGAVVLAAGRSRRMGTQKLLLPWRGKALIAHVVDAVQASPVAPVCVVTGADGSAVAKALAGRQVQFVGNPDGEGDMLSSVRCGLRALPAACVAALVVLGDQPTITAEAITALLAAARASACGIVVPVCAGRRGHPLCIARRHWAEILSGFQGVGLRGLLAGQAADVLEVPMRDARGFGDVDRPEDYRRLTGGAGTTSDEAAANVSLIDETTGCTTERR
jgi:molybdenum cofactor cytidylyltransferase